MKTQITVLLILAFLTGHILTLQAQNDFRSTTWGMSKQQVKSKEQSKLIGEEQIKLYFESPLAGIRCTTIFTFTESDKLYRTKYFLTPDYINMNFYLRDYKMFIEMLTQKYGEPLKKTFVTPTIKEKIDEIEWPAYLAAGELRIEYIWNNGITDIILTISKIMEKPAIQIDYISKIYNEIDLKEKKEKILKML